MITMIFIGLFALILLLDYRLYKCVLLQMCAVVRRTIAIVLGVANFLPLIMMMLFTLSSDNVEWQTVLAGWIFTLYVVVTLVRLAFYAPFFLMGRGKRAVIFAATMATAVATLLIYSIVVTRTAIVVEEVEVSHSEIPTSFDGYRIVQFSDLHIGSLLNAEREVDDLVSIINAQNADLVLFSGDLIHIRHSELSGRVAQRLAAIRSRDGVVAVLGNHDTGVYIKDSIALPREENMAALSQKIADMDWTLLCDSTIYVRRATDSIAVSGVAFSEALLDYKHSFITPDTYSADGLYNTMPDSIFNITITHLPQLWERLKEGRRADLTLAGHVHAMQMKLSICDMEFSPAMLMYGEWSGLYGDANEGYLYVNDGIGSVGYYMRIGANPRITLLRLRHNALR